MTQCVFISQFLKRKYPPSFLRNIFLTICRSVCARCVLLRFNDFSSFWKSWLYDFRRIFEMSLESWIVSRDHIFFPYRHISSKKLTKGSHKRREVTLQEYMVFEIKQITTRSSKQQLTFFFLSYEGARWAAGWTWSFSSQLSKAQMASQLKKRARLNKRKR